MRIGAGAETHSGIDRDRNAERRGEDASDLERYTIEATVERMIRQRFEAEVRARFPVIAEKFFREQRKAKTKTTPQQEQWLLGNLFREQAVQAQRGVTKSDAQIIDANETVASLQSALEAIRGSRNHADLAREPVLERGLAEAQTLRTRLISQRAGLLEVSRKNKEGRMNG